MKTHIRRAISKIQHRISLNLVVDQDQEGVGRQRYIRGEAFRSNLFGRDILPIDEKLYAAFLDLRNCFQAWIARAKPRFVMRLIQNAIDRWAMEYDNELRALQRFATPGSVIIHKGHDEDACAGKPKAPLCMVKSQKRSGNTGANEQECDRKKDDFFKRSELFRSQHRTRGVFSKEAPEIQPPIVRHAAYSIEL